LRVILADDCASFRADGTCLSRQAVIGDERHLWCTAGGAYRKKLSTCAATFRGEITAWLHETMSDRPPNIL
jgi:hypothetical protein